MKEDIVTLQGYENKMISFNRQWLEERVREDFNIELNTFLALYTFDDTKHYEGIYKEDFQ